jgi:hypothetical protein
MRKKITKKKLLVVGVTTIAVVGFFLITRSPEEHGPRATFIGFTNGTIGPHAIFLLQGPVSWNLREVAYKKGKAWETWIPPSRGGAEFGSAFRRTNQTDRWWGPQPFEFTFIDRGTNLAATVSIPDTNAHSRVVFDLQEPRHGLSELVWKVRVLLTERGAVRRFHLRMTRTRADFLTNEINISAHM